MCSSWKSVPLAVPLVGPADGLLDTCCGARVRRTKREEPEKVTEENVPTMVVNRNCLALAAPHDFADARRRLEALSCALVARRPIITGNGGAGPQRSTTGYWLHPIQDALSPASIRSILALFLCSSAFGTGGDSRPIQQGMVCDLNHSEEVSGPYKEQSYPL